MTWDRVQEVIQGLKLPDDVRSHALEWVATEKEAGTPCPSFTRFDYDFWGWRLNWEDQPGAQDVIKRLIDPDGERP